MNTKTIAAAMSPSIPPKVPARERRRALTAWLDRIEFGVAKKLTDIGLPEDLAGLRERLSELIVVDTHDREHAVILMAKRMADDRQQKYWRGYHLLCCLKCIHNSRFLLKRGDTEGIAFQALYLGQRLTSAGFAIGQFDIQQRRQGRKKGGQESGETRAKRTAKHKRIAVKKANEHIGKGVRKNKADSLAARHVNDRIRKGELKEIRYDNGRVKEITPSLVGYWRRQETTK